MVLNVDVELITMCRDISIKNPLPSDEQIVESEIREEDDVENGSGIVDEIIDDEFRVVSCRESIHM